MRKEKGGILSFLYFFFSPSLPSKVRAITKCHNNAKMKTVTDVETQLSVCVRANIDWAHTRSSFHLFKPTDSWKKGALSLLQVAVSLTTRQQFGKNPPSSQPQRTQKPKHSQMCVCVFACMSAALLTAHFAFLWMERQTWRCHIFTVEEFPRLLSSARREAELFLFFFLFPAC